METGLPYRSVEVLVILNRPMPDPQILATLTLFVRGPRPLLVRTLQTEQARARFPEVSAADIAGDLETLAQGVGFRVLGLGYF